MYLTFNHNLKVMKNTTSIEKCLEVHAVTYILTITKGYFSLYYEKIAFCLNILFTQYTCASLWWQLVLNTANLWMQLTLKAAVATHVLDVFTGWFTPSTGLARVMRIICQKSHNLVRLSDEYILCCDLDYENFDLDPERVIKYNTRGPFYHHGLTLIPAWISNHMPRKVWAEITHPFPNFNGCTVEFGELITNFIPLFIMDPITHPCWD